MIQTPDAPARPRPVQPRCWLPSVAVLAVLLADGPAQSTTQSTAPPAAAAAPARVPTAGLDTDTAAAFEHKARGRDAAAAAAFAELAARAMAAPAADDATALAAEAQASLALVLHERRPLDAALPQRIQALRTSPLAGARPDLADQIGIACLQSAIAAGSDEAAAQAAGLGCLGEFWICGPFDNERGAAFGRTLPAEQGFDPGVSHPGKQRPVSWRPLPAVAPAGVLQLEWVLRPASQAACLLAVALTASDPGPAALHIGCAGSFRVLCNGVEVGARDVERPFAFDQDAVVLPLLAGPNLLLVKLCHQEAGKFQAALRLAALRGGPLAGVRASILQADLERAATVAGAPRVADQTASQGARSRIAAADARGVQAFWLAQLLQQRAADSEAERTDRELAARAVADLPESAEARLLLAVTRLRRTRSRADVDDNERRTDLEAVLQLDPKHVEAMVQLGQLLLTGTGLRQQAEQLAQAALAIEPDAVQARLLLADALRAANLDELAHRQTLIVAGGDGSPRAALRAAARQALADERPAAAAPLLEQLTAASGDVNDLLLHVEFLLRLGRPDAARALLQRASRLQPLHPQPFVLRARLAEADGRLDDAVRELGEWLRLCPDDDEALSIQSRLFGLRGDRDSQLEALQTAIDCNPNRRDDQRYLEFLRAETAPFYAAYQRDGKALLGRATPADVTAGNDPLYHLLRQRVVQAHRNGTTSEYLRSIVRVLNDAGARSLASFRLPHFAGEQRARLLQCTVYKADGTVEQPRLRGASVSLASLRPGDSVDIEGRVDDLAPSFFGDYFGLFHLLPPPDGSAVHRSELVVITAPGRHCHHQVENGAAAPAQSTLADGSEVSVFAADDLPRDVPEPNRPDPRERLPLVRMTTFADWDQFADWYWRLIRGQLETTPAMRAKIAELTKDCPTDEERIAAIYRFVTTDVRYEAWEFGVHGYKPYSTAVIFERRHGDCKDKALLLCAMLGELGIQARPVLVFADERRTRDDLTLPMVEHFNHCIAWLPPASARPARFLDCTATWHPPSVLPTMDQGASVLVVDAGRARRLQVPWTTPEDNGPRIDYEVQLRADGGAEIAQVQTPVGNAAVELRAALAAEPARRKEHVERSLVGIFGPVQLADVAASDPLRYEQPLRLQVTFTALSVGQRDGAEWRLPSTFGADPLLELASSPERASPLLLGVPVADRRVVRYRLPPGAGVATLPADVEHRAPFGSLQMRWARSGDQIEIRRTLTLTVDRIEVGDYAAFRDFLGALRAADERVVVVQLPEAGR